MHTKLKSLYLALTISTLWVLSPPAAANAPKLPKMSYIGIASWYGKRHQGRKMADGQRFDRRKLTAASWYFPLGSTIRVVNLNNGASVVVKITDRGPNLRLHRLIDLSEAAAANLDYIDGGLTRVFVYPLTPAETQRAVQEAAQYATQEVTLTLDSGPSSHRAETSLVASD